MGGKRPVGQEVDNNLLFCCMEQGDLEHMFHHIHFNMEDKVHHCFGVIHCGCNLFCKCGREIIGHAHKGELTFPGLHLSFWQAGFFRLRFLEPCPKKSGYYHILVDKMKFIGIDFGFAEEGQDVNRLSR